jgi:hypothetical protein
MVTDINDVPYIARSDHFTKHSKVWQPEYVISEAEKTICIWFHLPLDAVWGLNPTITGGCLSSLHSTGFENLPPTTLEEPKSKRFSLVFFTELPCSIYTIICSPSEQVRGPASFVADKLPNRRIRSTLMRFGPIESRRPTI